MVYRKGVNNFLRSLMKVYGQCCNPPLLEAIQRFLGAFLTSLDSINYQLLDLETFLAIKFMREVVYS
jgi:hypothetical protein